MPIALISVGAGLDFKALRGARLNVAAASAASCRVPSCCGARRSCRRQPARGAVAAGIGATPAAAAGYTLAREMGGDAQLMAAIITATTLVSFVTMPLVIAIARP